MSLVKYAPSRHIFTCGGSIINGFADGTFVNIEPTSDEWVMTNGIRSTIVVLQDDTSATITLTLQYGQAGNDILGNFRKLNLANPGAGFFNFLAVDTLNPGNQHLAGVAWCRRAPTFTGSKDAPNYEWILDTNDLKFDISAGVIV